jgi:hypothetical protein
MIPMAECVSAAGVLRHAIHALCGAR